MTSETRVGETVSSPLATVKSSKPPSILGINIFKTWHSYLLALATIDIDSKVKEQ
jgi:hypothetical protein